MATQLSFEEKLGVFQIDPKQATLEDISKMATELNALKERDEHRVCLKCNYHNNCQIETASFGMAINRPFGCNQLKEGE